MPTYQYACTACDERLEAVQSFTDAPLTECPACGGALRKVFSAVGVVFKGSGFYKNDSRSTAGASDGKSDGAKPDGKSDGKSDGAKSGTTSDGAAKGGDKAASSSSSAGSSTSAKPATATPASKSA